MRQRLFIPILVLGISWFLLDPARAAVQPLNLLVITVDDMNADSVGVFGSAVEDSTPRIDALAGQGLRFDMAHVQVANCKPSRNVMWTGRYPHASGVEGFYPVKDPGYPTLMEVLRKAGYFTAIRNKVTHSTPFHPWPWDMVLDTRADGTEVHPKDPGSYGKSVFRAIEGAAAAGKPLFLLVNIDDPHLPFYGEDKAGNRIVDPYRPSRIFSPGEIVVPAFLHTSDRVQEELASYYSTVRRADDAVGAVLDALESAGRLENTAVVFLSDHGMPLPFAKTQLYHHSTRTPLIVRWPGITTPGAVDQEHMVSAIDLMPTLLEGLEINAPQGLQGNSFLSLLGGGKQPGRESVFKVYNENAGGQRRPMRAVQTRDFLYIYNPWADPAPMEIWRPWSIFRTRMHSASMGTRTWKEMSEVAKYDRHIAWRADLLRHRVPEELYDMRSDRDALVNLINVTAYAEVLDALRAEMEHRMRATGDHALEAFMNREDRDVTARYLRTQQLQSTERRMAVQRLFEEKIAEVIREERITIPAEKIAEEMMKAGSKE